MEKKYRFFDPFTGEAPLNIDNIIWIWLHESNSTKTLEVEQYCPSNPNP